MITGREDWSSDDGVGIVESTEGDAMQAAAHWSRSFGG